LAEKQNFLTKLFRPIFIKTEKTEKETLFGKLLSVKEEKEEKVKGELGDPKSSYKMVIDSQQGGVERFYFWVLRFLEKPATLGLGFDGKNGKIIKIKDLYTSAETSTYFGNVEQKKAAQQDRISTYLANVGKFTKELFQILRELRILDERLTYYDQIDAGKKAADIALKGIWIDLVEGGSQNVASVYGLANKVGFVTLPDLFFDTFVKKSEDVEKEAFSYQDKGINRKVCEVLTRKLQQYMLWKEKTEKELRTRRNFVLAYLAQEYNVIKMYASWLKPYMENVKKLQQNRELNQADIVTAFETAKIELELLAVKNTYSLKTPEGYEENKEFQKVFPCIRVTFNYTTIPQMSFQQEYQRAAIHTGHTEIKFEGYVVEKEELDAYVKKQNEDAFDILISIDETLAALKDELYKYLDEAQKQFKVNKLQSLYPKTEEEKEPDQSIVAPFKAVFDGFKEVFSFGYKKSESKDEEDKPKMTKHDEVEEKEAADGALKLVVVLYDIFKKNFGMFTP